MCLRFSLNPGLLPQEAGSSLRPMKAVLAGDVLHCPGLPLLGIPVGHSEYPQSCWGGASLEAPLPDLEGPFLGVVGRGPASLTQVGGTFGGLEHTLLNLACDMKLE